MRLQGERLTRVAAGLVTVEQSGRVRRRVGQRHRGIDEVVQRGDHGQRRRDPLGRVAGHHPPDYDLQLLRDFIAKAADRGRRLVLPGHQLLDDRSILRERLLPGEEPVQRATQGVDVGANVDGACIASLLRRHVVDGAEQAECFRVATAAQPRQSEVEDLDLSVWRAAAEVAGVAVGHQEVGRLDVAMNQAVLVRVAQAVGSLADEIARQRNRQRPAFNDVLLEVLPGDELHDQVAQDFPLAAGYLDLTGVKSQHDVRVAEHGQRLHLASEPFEKDRLGLVLVDGEHLERNRALHMDVLGLVDDTHPTGADAVEDAVVAQDKAERLAGEHAARLVVVEKAVGNEGLGQERRVVLPQVGPVCQERQQLVLADETAFGEVLQELFESWRVRSTRREFLKYVPRSPVAGPFHSAPPHPTTHCCGRKNPVASRSKLAGCASVS